MSPIKKLVFADWLLVSRPSFRPVSPKDLTNECSQNTVSDVASNLAQWTLRNKQHQHLNPRTCYQKTYEFLHKSHQHCSVQGQISNFFLPWPCWYSRAPFCRSLMVKSWGNKKNWGEACLGIYLLPVFWCQRASVFSLLLRMKGN